MYKLIFVFILLSSPFSLARDWNQQHSEHFTIIYNAKQRQLANYYLSIAEKVYEELIPHFKEAPKNTYLVLTDYFDFSNGAATVFPNPTVYLFPHLPDTNDTIENHSSWAYLLLKHEYTHILNMYPTNGVPKALHYLFGAWVKPNMFLPRWYIEGLAVERESEGSERFGRLNSSYYNGLLRSYYLEGQIDKESIDRFASFDIPQYPYGSRPYFLGAYFWKYLTTTYSDSIIYDLNEAYSRRLPWLIEPPIMNVSQKSYSENLQDAYDFYEKRVQQEIKSLNATEHNTSNHLKGHFQRNFSVHPTENKAFYITTNDSGRDELRLIEFSDRAAILFTITSDKRINRSDKKVRAEWSPDGQSILFDRLHAFEGMYRYLDLYAYNIYSRKTIALSKGKRLRDATYLNQNEIVAVAFKDFFKLQKLNVVTAEITDLHIANREEKILRPIVFQKDIFFVLKRPDGYHQVMRLKNQTSNQTNGQTSDPASGQVTELVFESKFPLHSLSVCEDSICWLDETSGVSNFVRYDFKTKSLQPLTNSRTSILSARLQDEVLYYSELNANGSFVSFATDPKVQNITSLRSNEASDETNGETQKTKQEWSVDLLDSFESPYYSTKHLYPKYWVPFIFADENGTYTSVQTGASDPATLQAYSLQLGHYSANQEWDKTFSYQNIYWDVLLSLDANETYEYIESTQDSIRRQRARLGFTTSLYPISEDLYVNVYGDLEKSGYADRQQRKAQGVGLRFTYDQMEPIPHGHIVAKEGYLASLGYSEYFKSGDSYDFNITEGHFKQSISYLLPADHTIHYRLAARKSDANGRPLSLGSLSIGGDELSVNDYMFAIRGYPNGNFLAWSSYLAQINYTFPLYNIFRGPGTAPIFTKRLFINLVAETLAIDGAYYNKNDQLVAVDTNKSFSAYGLELKASTEVLYLMPINLVLGYYFGTSETAGGDDRLYLRIEASL